MKVLITGAAGFAGRHLAKHLQRQGLEVWGTKLPHDEVEPETGIIFRDMNIVDIQETLSVLEECLPDYIIHLAAQSSVAQSWFDTVSTMNINLNGTINLLNAIRSASIRPRTLLVGSGEEYGPVIESDIPINENTRPNPQNPYALSKMAMGMIGLQYARSYDMPIILARSFNHTGPGQGLGFVVPDFSKQIAEIEAGLRKPVINVGNLAARRDFSDVRDVVRAYSLLVKSGMPGQYYNIGSNKAYPIRYLLDCLLKESNVEIAVDIDESKFRPLDVPIIECDATRLRRETGWKNEFSIEETLHDTLNYWRKCVNNPNLTMN